MKFEYTINQGIAPTLIYPIPTPDTSPVFGRIIHSIRDYYPLWQVCNLFPCWLSFSIRCLACIPKHSISLSLISFHWVTSSSNTRNSNTLIHSRAPFNYTCVRISIRIFSWILGSWSCVSLHMHWGNMRGACIVSILSFSSGIVEPYTLQCERVFPCGTRTRGCTRASVQDGGDRSGRLAGYSRCISCCNADRNFTLPCTSLTRAVALPRIMSCYRIA